MISALINTCNEAHHLAACVTSVRQVADEIVVCDMESEDGSAKIAKDLGCRVISHRRLPAPEPEARLAAIAAASGDWLFVFDPDMRLPATTAQRIRQAVADDEADIMDFYCEHYYFGRRCQHGHGSQGVYRKLFKRAAFHPRCTNIHTFWHESLTGRVLKLGRAYPITHLAYATVGQAVATLMRYAHYEAEQAHSAGIRPSLWRLFWLPAKRLAGNLVLRLAVLDGMPGIIVAGLVSSYLFCRECYLWEHWQQRSAGDGICS